LVTLPKNCWTTRVLGSVVIQLYAGECTPSVVRALLIWILFWRSAHGCRHRRGGGEGGVPPWIFLHNNDKVEGGLMLLFFGLVFSFGHLLKIFLPTPLVLSN